jgi:Flp pilus assembly protein CpaB
MAPSTPPTTSPTGPLASSSVRRRLHRFVVLRRRWLAAGLACLAVLVGLRGTDPPPPPTRSVVVAARDLPGGGALGAGDLVVRRLPADAVPSGATAVVADLAGRTLAAPVRAGEVLTDRRVVAPSLVAGYPGLVAVPVRVAEAGVLRLLRVGDVVDVVAAPVDGSGRAWVAAPSARVVVVPEPDERDASAADTVGGGLVVVAVTPDQALGLVGAASARLLTVTWSD